jgi:pyruvate/2-oxoglutarate dehydrogenase complex dihydrolipoamide acyltransferase (E2) component
MILKLEMPTVDQSLRGGRIVAWYKNEGDPIAFGDEICKLAIDEFAVLRRTARATLLSGRRRKKLKDDLEVRQGKVYLEVELRSSDQGVLRKHLVHEGEPLAHGDLLAVVVTEDHGELTEGEQQWRNAPSFRVVVNVAGGENDLEEGE